ncbi:hypothetical protein ACQ4PT_042662 [Festuca glaucescens]
MTGHNLGAARAKQEEDYVKSQIAGETLCFLYMMLLVTLGLSTFGQQAGNSWSRHGLPALDVLVTVLYFTAVTIEMQIILAIVLASEPTPSRLPPPLDEWVMATAVWLFLVNYFLGYAMTLHAPEPTYVDLTCRDRERRQPGHHRLQHVTSFAYHDSF